MPHWQDSHLQVTNLETLARALTLQTLWEDTIAAARIAGDSYLSIDERVNLKTTRGLAAKAASTNSTPERDILLEKSRRSWPT